MLDERLLFIGYMSFYNDMDFIKSVYQRLPMQLKYVYKYYIYAQRYLDEKTCDLIWLFLNAEEGKGESLLRIELSNRRAKFRI